jgi:DNA-binding CsgD family transcriptional regulator
MPSNNTSYAELIAIHSDILFPDDIEPIRRSDALPETVQRVFFLTEGICYIGRNVNECHVWVRPERTDISRKHALIEQNDPFCVLHDVQSKYGTFVNGQRINGPWRLTTGDIIGLAGTRDMLLFRDPRQQEILHIEPLTDRELEVLRLVATGLTNQAIADELKLSVNTVKERLKSIFLKLGVETRTEAVHAAQRHQLI